MAESDLCAYRIVRVQVEYDELWRAKYIDRAVGIIRNLTPLGKNPPRDPPPNFNEAIEVADP